LIYEIGKALNSNQHRNAAGGDQNMIGGQLEMQISVCNQAAMGGARFRVRCEPKLLLYRCHTASRFSRSMLITRPTTQLHPNVKYFPCMLILN